MILLMRHGEDDPTRLGGWSDAGLSSSGREQARLASETICREYHISHIFTSDLPRAKETADCVAGKLGLAVTARKEFRETNNGDLAGISKELFRARYPGLYYSSLEWEQRYPNGESQKLFFERIEDAWKKFKKEANSLPGDVLLVTHGGVIDIILCLENGIPYTNQCASHRVSYAEIVPIS